MKHNFTESAPLNELLRAVSRRRWFPLAGALVLSLIASTAVSAAERVWDGSARGNGWNDIGNWVGTGVPVAGDSLRFPAGALKPANNNDFPAGTVFTALTYEGAGYTASGNEIGLTGGIVVSHGAGNTVLNLPISVEGNQTFNVSMAGANLYLNGIVDLGGIRPVLTFDGAGQTIVVGDISDGRVAIGGGGIRKNGAGTLWIFQNPTLNGPTTVNGGTLRVDGRMSNSVVTVNASATLRGTGKVGGLTVNSGGAVSPGVDSPDILDSLGDVALNAGSAFNVRLNGTNVGLNYDQLKVQGVVTLGGTLNVSAGFVAVVGDIFTIIDNDGTDDVVGTFAGLPEHAILTINSRPFQISYGARGLGGFGRDVNDVTLEAVPALSLWDGGGNQNKFWSEPFNWVGDVAPMPGDDVQIIFITGGSLFQTTINDFPSGRVFGSIGFSPGGTSLILEGNPMQVMGDIRIVQPAFVDGDVELRVPLALAGGIGLNERGALKFREAVALSASQTFRAGPTNATLNMEGPLALGTHHLTVDNDDPAVVHLRGMISGSGDFIKEGSGRAILWGTNTSTGPTIANEGKLTIGPGALLNSPITVNAGATIAVLGRFADLEVRGGGTLDLPLQFPPGNGIRKALGDVRLQPGSTLQVHISQTEDDEVVGSSLSVSNEVELGGCRLLVRVDYPNLKIEAGTRFHVFSSATASPVINGTFDSLPEGAPFIADGRTFTITYLGGPALIAGGPVIWDGGGPGNLATTASNWVNDVVPLQGNSLIFPAGVEKQAVLTDFASETSFPSFTFSGPSYVVAGNSFHLTKGIYNDFGSGETVINADFVASGDPFECRVSGTSRLRLEGGVTRGGIARADWKKTGTGTLRFAGTAPNVQSYVEVCGGELELDKPSGVDAISKSLAIGDATNEVRVTLLSDHQIADSSYVTVQSHARFDLNGHDEVIDVLEGFGTVSLGGRTIPGRSGRLTVSSGYFSGTIVGDGGLTKGGPSYSSLWLSGDNTFSGLTILADGELCVEGIQTNSPIRLNGGVLHGRGSVGTITGNLGGTLQPGFGGADFQVALHSRDVTLNSTTTFRALLTSSSPGYENHKLHVAGNVSLGGSALSVGLLGSFRPALGRSFVIIDNDGSDPVVGTFAALPEGAIFGGDGLPFQISYVGGTGNDVVLTRVATPPSTLSSITALSNGQMRIEGLGISGVVYPIHATSNLNPVILWTPVGNGTGNASGIFQFLDTSASNRAMRFYRSVSP